MKDGAGLGLAGPQQLGCRKVRLLRARVAYERGGKEGGEMQQDLLLLEGCKYRGDALPRVPMAWHCGSSSEEEEVPGVPSTQPQPCQEPEPAAGLQKKPHPRGTLPSQEPSQPARGQARQASRCWK